MNQHNKYEQKEFDIQQVLRHRTKAPLQLPEISKEKCETSKTRLSIFSANINGRKLFLGSRKGGAECEDRDGGIIEEVSEWEWKGRLSNGRHVRNNTNKEQTTQRGRVSGQGRVANRWNHERS